MTENDTTASPTSTELIAVPPVLQGGVVGLLVVGLPMITIFPLLLVMIAHFIASRSSRRVGGINEESGRSKDQSNKKGSWQPRPDETGRVDHAQDLMITDLEETGEV